MRDHLRYHLPLGCDPANYSGAARQIGRRSRKFKAKVKSKSERVKEFKSGKVKEWAVSG